MISIKIIGDGYKKNKLTFLSFSKRMGKAKDAAAFFGCECGGYICTRLVSVVRGETKSCGCINIEQRKNGKKHSTHRMSKCKEYNIWSEMKQRCNNKNCKNYKNYGGRGIRVCAEWESFETFYKDMGQRSSGFSLDRIDNNGNYCKENCRWATAKEQVRNTRRAMLLSYKGLRKCIADWCDELDITYNTIRARIYNGWAVEDALEKPINGKHSGNTSIVKK